MQCNAMQCNANAMHCVSNIKYTLCKLKTQDQDSKDSNYLFSHYNYTLLKIIIMEGKSHH